MGVQEGDPRYGWWTKNVDRRVKTLDRSKIYCHQLLKICHHSSKILSSIANILSSHVKNFVIIRQNFVIKHSKNTHFRYIAMIKGCDTYALKPATYHISIWHID
jgi:hypothetical protein